MLTYALQLRERHVALLAALKQQVNVLFYLLLYFALPAARAPRRFTYCVTYCFTTVLQGYVFKLELLRSPRASYANSPSFFLMFF